VKFENEVMWNDTWLWPKYILI